MEIEQITEKAVIDLLTSSRKELSPSAKKAEMSVHTLLGVLDMRAYTEGGIKFEWVVGGLYRETITEMLIEKLKKI